MQSPESLEETNRAFRVSSKQFHVEYKKKNNNRAYAARSLRDWPMMVPYPASLGSHDYVLYMDLA